LLVASKWYLGAEKQTIKKSEFVIFFPFSHTKLLTSIA